MNVKIIASKPESSDCYDITPYIGKVYPATMTVTGDVIISVRYNNRIGLFPGEYEIVER